jgi:hypothetical protein
MDCQSKITLGARGAGEKRNWRTWCEKSAVSQQSIDPFHLAEPPPI